MFGFGSSSATSGLDLHESFHKLHGKGSQSCVFMYSLCLLGVTSLENLALDYHFFEI